MYVSYVSRYRRVAAETETEETVPTSERQDETNDVQIEIEKGKEEKKKKISQHQERKKTARRGNTYTSGSQGAQGGCSAETK